MQFYRRTHITEGLHRLLVNALRRLAGQGGDLVVELQTNFGGGKTHSMLVLYHLFTADRASDLVGIEPVLAEAAVEQVPRARIAVLVGTALSPSQTHEKPDGTVIHTLWGELAWQLGNYGLVAEADRRGVSSRSDALRALFGEAGPCLVLIDEWLAHARQLAGKDGMPAGSLAANLSLAQALTEAARAVAGTLVVVTVPESEIEKGGRGRPRRAGASEERARPHGLAVAAGERRGELRDRGSSLDRFQRTRGVLRLMAKGRRGPTTRASAVSPPAGEWPARSFSARRRRSRRRTAGSRTRRSGSEMYRPVR